MKVRQHQDLSGGNGDAPQPADRILYGAALLQQKAQQKSRVKAWLDGRGRYRGHPDGQPCLVDAVLHLDKRGGISTEGKGRSLLGKLIQHVAIVLLPCGEKIAVAS